jgi:acetylxylan esterase
MRLPISFSFLLLAGLVASQACAPVHLIVARGSFEAQGEGIASTFSTTIKRSIPGATSEALVYPAVMPYSGSMDVGTEKMKQAIAKWTKSCPQTKLVLVGYSQGGAVIVDALCGASYNPKIGKHTNGLTQEEGKQIVLALAFGDPRFIPGMPYNLGTNSKSPGVSFLP